MWIITTRQQLFPYRISYIFQNLIVFPRRVSLCPKARHPIFFLTKSGKITFDFVECIHGWRKNLHKDTCQEKGAVFLSYTLINEHEELVKLNFVRQIIGVANETARWYIATCFIGSHYRTLGIISAKMHLSNSNFLEQF